MEDNKGAMQTVIRLFEEHRQDVEDPARRDWRWREGTLLFPEGRCCYCGEPVRSNRLWSVDNGWLRGQLNVEEAIFEKPEHPHAGTDGSLCLGDSNSPTEALFFGVNPGDAVMRSMDIPKWYDKMFGHVCGKHGVKASELFMARASGYNVDEDGDDGDGEGCDGCCHCCDYNCCSNRTTPCSCGCDECYCITTQCHVCKADIGEDYAQIEMEEDRFRWLCHTCWSKEYTRCQRCSVPRITREMAIRAEGAVCAPCALWLDRVSARLGRQVEVGLRVSPTTSIGVSGRVEADGTVRLTAATLSDILRENNF